MSKINQKPIFEAGKEKVRIRVIEERDETLLNGIDFSLSNSFKSSKGKGRAIDYSCEERDTNSIENNLSQSSSNSNSITSIHSITPRLIPPHPLILNQLDNRSTFNSIINNSSNSLEVKSNEIGNSISLQPELTNTNVNLLKSEKGKKIDIGSSESSFLLENDEVRIVSPSAISTISGSTTSTSNSTHFSTSPSLLTLNHSLDQITSNSKIREITSLPTMNSEFRSTIPPITLSSLPTSKPMSRNRNRSSSLSNPSSSSSSTATSRSSPFIFNPTTNSLDLNSATSSNSINSSLNSARYLDPEIHWLSEDEGEVSTSSRSRFDSGGSSNNNHSRRNPRSERFNGSDIDSSIVVGRGNGGKTVASFGSQTSHQHLHHSIHHRPSSVIPSIDSNLVPEICTFNPLDSTSSPIINIDNTSTTNSNPNNSNVDSVKLILPRILNLLTCNSCSELLKNPITRKCGCSVCLTCSLKPKSINREPSSPIIAVDKNSIQSKISSIIKLVKCDNVDCKGLNKDQVGSTRNAELESANEVKIDFVLQKVIGILTRDIMVLELGVGNRDELLKRMILVEVGAVPEDTTRSITAQIINTVDSNLRSAPILLELQSELECQVCYQTFYNPITTPCGHTYCQKCLARSLDHALSCALCRSEFPSFNYFQDHCINTTTSNLIELIFPTLFKERKYVDELEEGSLNSSNSFEIPIFICTLAWPNLPTFIHIFEPRYKLMMRRVMATNRKQFGMILPNRSDETPSEYGTMLEIQDIQVLNDGRSIVSTIGSYRFRLISKTLVDGYNVGRVERVDDISSEQEAELERIALSSNLTITTPIQPKRRGSIFSRNRSGSSTVINLGTTSNATTAETSSILSTSSTNSNTAGKIELSTTELMEICLEFIQTLRNGSAPWVLQRLNNTIGPMPTTNVSDFSFWMAEVMPVDDYVKATLLQITSPRERLRLIVFWIEQFKSSWWFTGCLIM